MGMQESTYLIKMRGPAKERVFAFHAKSLALTMSKRGRK